MTLWVLRTVVSREDGANNVVVQAESEINARFLASSWDWRNGAIWLDPTRTQCEASGLTDFSDEKEQVLRAF